MKLHTYLNFNGNCEQAFRFYEQHLGAKIVSMRHFSAMPDQSQVPETLKNAILHAELELAGTVILASDTSPDQFVPMRGAYLTLILDTVEEAERVYKLLAENGEVTTPMAETFFAPRFAILLDRFGTSWMLMAQRPQS